MASSWNIMKLSCMVSQFLFNSHLMYEPVTHLLGAKVCQISSVLQCFPTKLPPSNRSGNNYACYLDEKLPA